jgi:hypothetical protein
LAVISPTLVTKAEVGEEVNWTTNGSGVGLETWAETEASEPPMNRHTMLPHKNQKTCFTNSSAIKKTIRAD